MIRFRFGLTPLARVLPWGGQEPGQEPRLRAEHEEDRMTWLARRADRIPDTDWPTVRASARRPASTGPPRAWPGSRRTPITVTRTVAVGGMPGWQIVLIAIVAALLTAAPAVMLDRARAARRA